MGRGGQRQVRAAARARARSSPQAGEGAGLHPVPRDRPSRWRRFWAASSAAPGWCCTAARRSGSARSWSSVPGGRARRSSCSRSRPAGGLNLTAASHVIHFDRWWNPAVENQATDRAFRIGQTSNVLVHKFVCRGTVEEKIDQSDRIQAAARQGRARGRRRTQSDRAGRPRNCSTSCHWISIGRRRPERAIIGESLMYFRLEALCTRGRSAARRRRRRLRSSRRKAARCRPS